MGPSSLAHVVAINDVSIKWSNTQPDNKYDGPISPLDHDQF